MTIRQFFLSVFALSAFTQFAAGAYAQDAGAFERLTGSATITGSDNRVRAASESEKIRSGDTISTDARSEAMIKMTDNSVVVLRPNSQFRFSEYRYEDKPTDSSFSTLLRGAVRLVTGLIGKTNNANVAVRANTATIGIRGTDFDVVILEEGSSEGRAGVYSAVNDGATHVKIASGQEADVNKDQTAFAPAKPEPGEAPLQVLDTRPVFLRGGGFDSLMHQVTGQSMRAIQNMRR